MEGSDQIHVPAALSSSQIAPHPVNHWMGGWVRPTAGLDAKNISVVPGIKLQFLGRPLIITI
jgi:hypothetical protein